MAKKKRAAKGTTQRSGTSAPQKSTAKNRGASRRWMALVGGMVCIFALVLLAWPEKTKPRGPIEYQWKLVNKFPHDRGAYTQGLFFKDGVFFESTGSLGQSSVRKVDPETGSILNIRQMEDTYFGEGLAHYKGVLWQITWQNQEAIVYDSATLEPIRSYDYQGEGWGLTTDDKHLIMSDGSNELQFRDPKNFELLKTLKVTAPWPVTNLNELEYIDGEIWANVYQTNLVLRISPDTGKVLGRINFSGILDASDRHGGEDVLNGIAWDPEKRRIFITGKYYARVYEVALEEK